MGLKLLEMRGAGQYVGVDSLVNEVMYSCSQMSVLLPRARWP